MNKINSNVRAVIFDFDDTLVDTTAFFLAQLKHAMTKSSIEYTSDFEESALTVWRKNPPFEDIFTILFKERADELLSVYREDAKDTPYNAREEMFEFVKNLKKSETLLYILSNRTNLLEYRLDQAGYDSKDFKIFETPKESKKPKPGAYTETLQEIEELGINAEEILIIGNHPDDYSALPLEYKQQFIAVPRDEQQIALFKDIPEYKGQLIEKEATIAERIKLS